MEWEDVLYTITFLTILAMVVVGFIPISLMVGAHGNPIDTTVVWNLFFKMEAGGVLILTFTRVIIKTIRSLRSQKEDSW
jgi:hypothetical protein